MRAGTWASLIFAGVALFDSTDAGGQQFRVCTWNLEAYVDAATKTRFIKTEESKVKICECLLMLRPDVVALQEIGNLGAVAELQEVLSKQGLTFPYREHVGGFDTNIHIAVLSRFPITASRAHTNDSFLLSGRRFRVSRGIAELDIQVATNYSFTLFAAHLKSKRPIPEADEAELRLEEARVLREKIDTRLRADPKANVVVVGDFNDTQDTPAVKAVVGRGRHKLIDTRPAERNGDATSPVDNREEPRRITWTHYYPKQDTFSRIDFILISRGMVPEWVIAESYVLAIAGWGLASDHRPIVATFQAADQ